MKSYKRIDRTSDMGFTLVELMATIAIFGILLSIAIPPLYRSMDTQTSRQDAESLACRIRLARSQAIVGYTNVVVYFNVDGAGTYTIHLDNGGGTGVPSDPDFDPGNKNNNQIDANEKVHAVVSLSERSVFGYVPGGQTSEGQLLNKAISFGGSPQRVVFHADGSCSESGWVCVMPLSDFMAQQRGRDFLVELVSYTGEVQVLNTEH